MHILVDVQTTLSNQHQTHSSELQCQEHSSYS